MPGTAWRATRALCLLVLSSIPSLAAVAAQSNVVEEIIVTARQKQESLQDVPVTVAVLTESDLDRYAVTTLTEASKMVPNFSVYHGGSGNGSNIILRGIGSSSISAAFDQSVAINIDGVVVNIGRFIHNAYLDMGQLEVLKGPQSLYFGKSATAGVVSVTTNDPGDEFEIEGMVGYETEYDQEFTEFVVSGPLTDTFGARVAVGRTNSNELFENLTPGVVHEYRGEEAINARLTLVWEPNDRLKVRGKWHYAEYENDGANGRTEEICPEGHVQPSAIPAASFALALFPGVDDCDLNGNTSIADLNPALRDGLPYGGDSGVPFLDQDTDLYSLEVDWLVADQWSLTSITAYANLEHKELDIYDYNAGVFGGLHRNVYRSTSQEFRLASAYEGPLNYLGGFYFQQIEQVFNAYQYAFNLGLIAGPDPATGNEYDYNKNHYLDTDVLSYFGAVYWDILENLELTVGARYTSEDKEGHITIPYIHAAAGAFGFGAPSRIEGLDFDDNNLSPEVTLNWRLSDDISAFASYREGFKSGGIDNSALPTNSLDPAQNPDFPDFLIYESEEAQGFEAGIKTQLLDGTLQLNGTAFYYVYSDLQVQLFNAQIIQFETFNASELTTQGVELEASWVAPIEGLSLRGAAAFTDTQYTDDFVNATGENLRGADGALSTDFAGYVGATYDTPLFGSVRLNLSSDLRYNNGYTFTATDDPYEQDSYWLIDAALSLYTEDERYQLSLIGRNLGDEIVAQGAGARPGACYQANPAAPAPLRCTPTTANNQDQVVTTTLGVEYLIEFRVRF